MRPKSEVHDELLLELMSKPLEEAIVVGELASLMHKYNDAAEIPLCFQQIAEMHI